MRTSDDSLRAGAFVFGLSRRRATPVADECLVGDLGPQIHTARGRSASAAMTIRASPNVQTMVAPVGDQLTEKYMPNIDTITPITQPIASRGPIRSAHNIAPTDGTIDRIRAERRRWPLTALRRDQTTRRTKVPEMTDTPRAVADLGSIEIPGTGV